jgi:RNA polymerase sigma-70 factor (ECF subfamily)
MISKPYLRLAPPVTNVVDRAPVRFELLFERYSGYVAALTARLLGSHDSDLDDVVQEVFWVASRRIDKIPDLIQARGWLATVTTRVVRRKLIRRRFRALFYAAPRHFDAPTRGATAEEHALISRLYEVLESLPVDQRIAWSLRYLDGEPLDTISAACGCSQSTAKRRIGAAKKVIDEVFRDE